MFWHPKYILFSVACLVYGNRAVANAIDSLKTKDEVNNFLSRHLEPEFTSATLINNEDVKQQTDTNLSHAAIERARLYGQNNFYKLDLDNNGTTDLLIVHGEHFYAILDRGGKYETVPIDLGWCEGYFYQQAIQLPDHSTALLFKRFIDNGGWLPHSPETDTIVYRFHALVEYHRRPSVAKIRKIDFLKHPVCFGDCTNIYLEITKSGAMVGNRNDFSFGNDSDKVCFGHLDSAQMADFWGLVTYMDVKTLDSSYANCNVTDQPTGLLQVYFEDGSVKTISDYGFAGTIGLQSIYDQLFHYYDLIKSNYWYCAPPQAYSYLVSCPIAFRDARFFLFLTRDQGKGKRVGGGQTFGATSSYDDGVLAVYVTLFPNHRFEYADSLKSSVHRASQFSAGYWRTVNDSTIELNWDGPQTLQSARNKYAYMKYFNEDVVPSPVKIQKYRFSYRKGGKTLRPLASPFRSKSIFPGLAD